MRLSVLTVLCCCVLTIVLPLATGATGKPNSSMRKRFRLWMQSHMERDVSSRTGTASKQRSDRHVGPEPDGLPKPPKPPSGFELNRRPKRSTPSKTSRCFLMTCAYQELFHRLHEMTNEQKEHKAPERKIGRDGYGRRRRSLPEGRELRPGPQRQTSKGSVTEERGDGSFCDTPDELKSKREPSRKPFRTNNNEGITGIPSEEICAQVMNC